MASPSLTTVSIILFLTGASYWHAQETSFPALPEGQFRSFAEQVIQEARKVNCKPPDCLILVLGFTNVSGFTSQLGVRLADELSQDLVLQQSAIQIIDRSRLHSFLEQERIPSNLLSEQEAEHWLGKEMGATTVLEGKMSDESASLHLKVRLLTSEKKKKGSIREITFPFAGLSTSLGATEPLAKKAASDSPSAAPRTGVGGVSVPRCRYCPPPSYTNPARAAKFVGTVVLEVVLSAEGRIKAVKIVRGAPYGLNAAAVDAVSKWKLDPAMREGQPLDVSFPIEVILRLF